MSKGLSDENPADGAAPAPVSARTITYGVIGCGMMGQEHLRNIALLPGTAIGAIFEPDAGMRALATRLAPGAQLVDSLDALLARQDLDCLLIASPNFLHVGQLQAIAARRPLPVLVEKPLFTAMSDLTVIDDFAVIRRRSGWRWNIAICRPSRGCCSWPMTRPAAFAC